MIVLVYFLMVIFIPYGVVGNALPWVLASATAMIIPVFTGYKSKVTSTGLKGLIFLYAYLVIHLMSINFYSMFIGINYSWNSGFDIMIYITFFLSTLVVYCKFNDTPSERSFIIFIGIISFGLFYSSVVAWMGNTNALNFSMLYSTGDVYNAGYAQFRAFGIIGQPGKLGFFSIILSIYLLIIGIRTEKYTYYFLSLLTFACAVSSFSRISLITYAIAVLTIPIVMKKVKVGFFVITVYIAFTGWVITEHYDKVEFLLRGVSLENLEFATLGHRLVLKQWSLDVLSNNFVHILMGVGSPKEYLESFIHPYAQDITLRHPDSSQTVILLRFGLLGSTIFYLVYIWVLRLYLKKRQFLTSMIITLYIVLSILDPTFHDLKLHVLFLLIIFCNVERFSKNGIS
jgi:hypothetical protein